MRRTTARVRLVRRQRPLRGSRGSAVEAERSVVAERRYRALQTLLHANEMSGSDLEALLAKAVDVCRHGLAADRVSIWLKDRSDHCLELSAVSQQDDVLRPNATRLPANDSNLLTGALASAEVLVADDVYAAPHLQDLLRRHPGTRAMKSRLDVPIVFDGETVGVMIVSMVRRKVRWQPWQICFARDIAAIISLGVERRSRLTSEAELVGLTKYLMAEAGRREQREMAMERNQRVLTQLLQIDTALDRDVGADLQVLCDVVRQTLGIERIAIWIGARNNLDCMLVAASDRRGTPVNGIGSTIALQDLSRYVRALQQCRPLATTDAASAPHLVEVIRYFPRVRACKARIDVPVLRDGRLVGAIVGVELEHAMSWSGEDIIFLTAASGIAAILIERRQRFELERDREKEARARDATRLTLERNQHALRHLLQDSRDADIELVPSLERLCSVVRSTLDVDRVALWLKDGDAGAYRQAAARERTDKVPVRAALAFTAADAPNYVSIMQCGEPVSTEDAGAAPHLAELRALFAPVVATKSRIDVPIVRNGHLIGMVIATDRQATRQWSPENLMLMAAVSGIAALLLERHERRAVEADLRRANIVARAASEAKSLFLANMSHEIRTPMNGVFGMTDLLLRTELSARQGRLVQTINQSARTLLTIINDILDLARIETGRLALDAHEFDLVQTCEGAVELFSEEARRKDLELSLFIAPDVPTTLIGDAGRLRQICINLIGNAIKFTQSGEVAVRVMARHHDADAPQVVIEVRDTGIGIAPDVQSQLFQPFAQADSSITRRFGGTGLGLSISMHLVERMGGRILLCSAPGEGTTIRVDVRLPRGTTHPVSTRADLSGKRILIIDSRPPDRVNSASLLAACGAECELARELGDAHRRIGEAAAEGAPFAAVVVDMVTPDEEANDRVDWLGADDVGVPIGRVIVRSRESTAVPCSGACDEGRPGKAPAIVPPQCVVRPLRRDDLVDAVVRAIATASDGVRLAPSGRIEARRSFRGRILVAEDNPVNVEVAREFLTALGFAVDVAADGAEAIERLMGPDVFDVVLMDCQMPRLDGLAATRRIRSAEAAAPARRIPIIAVTANAYEADRLACLDAGMDDYLSKPFTEDDLIACLTKWLPARETIRSRESVAEGSLTEPVDEAVVRNPQALARLRDTFITHSPRLLTELTEAAATGNAAALLGAAHSLRASSATVGADRLARLCAGLAATAQRHETADAVARVRAIAAEFRSVDAAIAARRRGTG